ncbi:hypothetical protein ACFWP5_08740 [Streptomyces sp. NPDC058469]|uniref:hypothetical protein n=1 Tax=Streptomyces sp. NPDC058469 TaxID=3346514 RepID=UPI00365DF485
MEAAPTVLLQYGIAGIAILAEAYVIGRLYSDNRQLQKEKDELQVAFRLYAIEGLAKIEGPLTAIAKSTDYIADKLEVAKPRSR